MDQSDILSLIREMGYDTAVYRGVATQVEKDFVSTGNTNLDRFVIQQRVEAAVKVEQAQEAPRALFDRDLPGLVRVSPGTLITAALINNMIEAIETLERRTRKLAIAMQPTRKDESPAEEAAPVAEAPRGSAATPRPKGPAATYKKRGTGYVMTVEAEDLVRGTVKGIRVGDQMFTGEQINFYDGKATVTVNTKPAEDVAVVIEKTNKAPVAMLAEPAAQRKMVIGGGAVTGKVNV